MPRHGKTPSAGGRVHYLRGAAGTPFLREAEAWPASITLDDAGYQQAAKRVVDANKQVVETQRQIVPLRAPSTPARRSATEYRR